MSITQHTEGRARRPVMTSRRFPRGTTVSMATNAYSAGVCPTSTTTFTGLTIAYTG